MNYIQWKMENFALAKVQGEDMFKVTNEKNENPNIPVDIAEKFKQYMDGYSYSGGTKKMRLGNLNFLFEHYGQVKMLEMLNSNPTTVWETIEFIEATLPQRGVNTSDLNAFKLAWESLHGIEIFKKKVKKNNWSTATSQSS